MPLEKEPKSSRTRVTPPLRPPAPTLNYFNATVAKEVARRERKIRIRRAFHVIGNGLAVMLFLLLCLLWKFGFTLAKMFYGNH